MTFLFTDIEDSTGLWERDANGMQADLARHDLVLRAAFTRHEGTVFATGGDGFAVVFHDAHHAAAAAAESQRALQAAALPPVRMGLHTGTAQQRDGNYFGPDVNRAARVMAIGHGGQVLASRSTAASLDITDLDGVHDLVDLGDHRLKGLSRPERVFQLTMEAAAAEFPPLRSQETRPSNLPFQPTRFVGRSDDVTRVRAALDRSRLVTLTGVGGVGKTRLALKVAQDLSDDYPDGAWLVELGGVTEAGMVAEATRSTLGVMRRPGTTMIESIAEHLADRTMLVVLDNCEHLVDAAATLAASCIATPGGTRILATSREGLAVPGERVIAVAPLGVPDADSTESVLGSDAVKLFVERAADVRDRFEPGPDDLAILAQICRRLDGIPLAIELAAARVRSIALPDILGHLDDRFHLLAGGRRTAPTRQHTLRSAIDWSHDLLDDRERVVLRRLSVFSGGFDLAAVQAVAAGDGIDDFEIVDVLDQLVNKSLVSVDTNDVTSRYRLLESIADYSWERLREAEETGAVAARHATHFAAFSAQAGAGLCGAEEADWSDRVDIEIENLRRALLWSIGAGLADPALRIVGGLAMTGYRVGTPFGWLALDAAEMPGGEHHPARPLALASAAWTALHLAQYDRAAELGNRAVDAARGLPGGSSRQWALSRSLSVLAAVTATGGDRPRSIRAAEERREIAAGFADPFEMSQALSMLATVYDDTEMAEEAVELARRAGNPTMLSFALSVLAILYLADPPRARDLLGEAIDAARDVGNAEAEALARQVLAGVQTSLGDQIGAARMGLAEAESLLRAGDRFYAYGQLWNVAVALERLGDVEHVRLLGAWLQQRGAVVAGLRPLRIDVLEMLTPDQLDAMSPRISAMSDADAIAMVRARIDDLESALHPVVGGREPVAAPRGAPTK